MIEIHPLSHAAEVHAGDNVAKIISSAIDSARLMPGERDVVVVTQKIVSKAEGRLVALTSVEPSGEALRLAKITGKDPRLIELILAESAAVMRAVPNVLITRHRRGYVMANAGIDRSNIGPGGDERVLLLPADPDASAAQLRRDLQEHFGVGPAIVISDSFGRAWRHGVVNVAIGASGLPSLIDKRGVPDRDGRPLEVTQIALADMAAAAAGLALGEAGESVPAVLIRGLSWDGDEKAASALIRPLTEDLFP